MLNEKQIFVSYKDPDKEDAILEGAAMAAFLVNLRVSRAKAARRSITQRRRDTESKSKVERRTVATPSSVLERRTVATPSSVLSDGVSVLSKAEILSSAYTQASVISIFCRC